MISEFIGRYYFLSNFFPCNLTYLGITYLNSEAAFQSMKTNSIKLRKDFQLLSPSQAKYKGRGLKLRSDWKAVKDQIMYEVCRAKFEQNPILRQMLISTGDEYLQEGNSWGDDEWGVILGGEGENKLGKILMRIRSEFIEEDMKK